MNIITTGKRCILILAALLIAACQTAPQDGTIKEAKSENVKTVETVETAETSEPKLICVRERPTGSHFTKKVCRTKAQIKAILRAAVAGQARILLPMVSNLDEVERARGVIAEAAAELAAAGVEHRADFDLGVMIEVPSAAITARQFAQNVDFFSLGTNDLVQYTLAVDRGTARVANLYDPLHPAVLHLIKQVADSAQAADIPAGICGEMASDPEAAVILIGLGILQLSVSPMAIPELKEVIRAIRLDDAVELAAQALTLTSGSQVRQIVQERIGEALHMARPRRPEGDIR